MTLQELSEAVGVPARTIRFYVSRGLLAGPGKAGRGAAYGPEHIERLERIKQMQAEGRMLAEIARLVDEAPAAILLDAPAAFWQYAVSGDVTVSVRADATPWRMRRIRRALEEFALALQEESGVQDQGKDERNPE